MKKLFGIVLALALCLCLALLPASAAEATASLAGPTTVRAGDTITLTFYLNGTNIYGIEGSLAYDSNQLTLIGTKQILASTWSVEFNGNKFVAYDDKMTSPINSATGIFTVTFQVKQLAEGTPIKVSLANVLASDGSTESAIAEVTYEATIARPLSSNNDLATLTVSNGTLSPAFDPNVTSYTIQVPYSVTRLNMHATAADANATVNIYNPELAADATTTVYVTVKSESGVNKIYTIRVTRAKDPNYQPSSNAFLSGIQVTEFRLSPVFSKNRTEYLIWLPFEVDEVEIKATAEDKKATVSIEGGKALVPGSDNEIKITVTAEDGTTIMVYTIIAKRAADHNTIPTQPTEPTTPPTTAPTIPESSAPPTTAPTQPTDTTSPSSPATNPKPTASTSSGDKNNDSVGMELTILYCAIAAISLIGIAVCILFVLGYRRKGRYIGDDRDFDDEDDED